MNENLNLIEILKDCRIGTKLYSTVYGDVEFDGINKKEEYPVRYRNSEGTKLTVTAQGMLLVGFGECTLFPSKEQRDWSKFAVKKPKFDPKTLQPFDKVLARDTEDTLWRCAFYSHAREIEEFPYNLYKYVTTDNVYMCCIPYNDGTKHLVGTADEAPEFYRYWEV